MLIIILASHENKVYRNGWVICLYFLSLTLVSALAYNIGSDTEGYVNSYRFSKILSNLNSYDFEFIRFQPGWILLQSCFKTLSNNYLLYQVFHAVFINYCILWFGKRFSKNLGFFLFFYCLMYYFDLNFEIQRESFCIMGGLFVYYLCTQNKIKNRYIYILFTIVFLFFIHKSALLLLLIPLFVSIKFREQFIIIGGILAMIAPILWSKFPYAEMIMVGISGDEDYVQQYLIYQLNNQEQLNAIYYVVHTGLFVIIPLLFVNMSSRYNETHYHNLAIISIIFESLANYSFAFHRVAGYFFPFYWLVLVDSILLLSSKFKIKFYVLVLLFSIYIIFTYRKNYFSYDNEKKQYFYEYYFPYRSVLEEGNGYN